MQRLLALLPLSLLLAGCGQSGPSQSEIEAALQKSVSGKGCATSVLFKTFPIPDSMARSNGDITKPFENIGFIAKQDGAYQLTDKGQAAYDAERSGFCYTEGYTISNIKITDEETEADRPQALSGAWYVNFQIAPSNVDEWVKNPEIIDAASRASLENIVQPKTFTVRLVKEKGDDKLFIADPRFSFSPGIHFNMGWRP
jgi:hypothetical protein